MSIKTISGLTGVVISLLAASQIGAEIPRDYRSWPSDPTQNGKVITYRNIPNRSPDARVVREFIENYNGIRWMIVGYGRNLALDPEKTPLEIKVRVGDSRYINDQELYGRLYNAATDFCGRCHPITNSRNSL